MASISTDELLQQIRGIELKKKRKNLRWLDSRSYVQTTKETAASLNHKITIKDESVEI